MANETTAASDEALQFVSSRGEARLLSRGAIAGLAAQLRGSVLRLGDAGYEQARSVWNGRVDRKPALIVQCAASEDVVVALRFARANDVLVSVRGGGHNVGGTAVCERGLMLDLSGMKSVQVSAETRRAIVGPGVRWKELDQATQAHGLAAPGGQHSEVGVTGFTLGGGVGWLLRKYGLAIDSLVSVELVTAEAELLRADAQQHSELFWALRGGGGNFGVVTSLELELHPVGPTVLAGLILHPLARAREALRHFRDYAERASDDVHPMAVLMTGPDGQRGVAYALCYDGTLDEGQTLLAPLRALGPALDMVQPMPYAALQGMLDGLVPAGRRYANHSRFALSMSDEALDAALAAFESAPSPGCTVFFHRLGGALARVAPDATAFAHRDAEYCFVVEAGWTEAAHDQEHLDWISTVATAIERFSTGAAYINDLGRSVDEGQPEITSAFGSSYERLARIKAIYDPSNFFSHNQNIIPATS